MIQTKTSGTLATEAKPKLAVPAAPPQPAPMTPEEFRQAAETARLWTAFRWAPWGAGVSVLMFAFDAVVWARAGTTTAAVLTVIALITAITFCVAGFPKLADRSWRNEQAQTHVFQNSDPYVTSFIFGFGFGSFVAGLPVAVGIYLLLR